MRIPVFALASAALLAACGSNQALLARRSHGEAQYLQKYCRQAGIVNAETSQADAALGASARLLSDGDEEKSAAESDRAAILYRLALARRDLFDARVRVDGLRKSLAKDQDQLATYQQILEEIKAVRKP